MGHDYGAAVALKLAHRRRERIARLLAGALPRAEWRRIEGADRMGTGPHPEAVDREIEGFLAQQQARRAD